MFSLSTFKGFSVALAAEPDLIRAYFFRKSALRFLTNMFLTAAVAPMNEGGGVRSLAVQGFEVEAA